MKSLFQIIAVVVGLFSISMLASPVVAQDTFSGEEVVVKKVAPSEPSTDSRRTLRLSLDEERVIYEEPTSADPRWYFYLPPEANSVVELIIQKRDGKFEFILKAIGRGKTVGGFVHREWLDDSGFQPKSELDETKIQHAVKSKPIFIIVD